MLRKRKVGSVLMGQFLDLSGLKILVVEHDPDNRMLYTILLEDA